MKKIWAIVVVVVCLLWTSGCESFDSYLQEVYPRVEYNNSHWEYDENNVSIKPIDGYKLNQGNSYEWIETEDGYDLVMHFIKGGEQ